jgi:predicted Ser/Thr protein kinase
MLNPWKHVMVEYKAFIVKMHFDEKKAKYACENLRAVM